MNTEAEDTVVAGLLQKPVRLAEVSRVPDAFFQGDLQRALFAFAQSYHRKRGHRNVLDLPLARSLLERAKAPAARKLLKVVREYETYEPITEPEFREALAQLLIQRQTTLIREHGAAALELVLEGDWRGAQERMRRGLVAVDDADLEDDRPADLHDPQEIAEERRAVDEPQTERTRPFDVGFRRITSRVSLRRTELTILGGYAADGKTQFSKTLVYNAHVKNKANVLFVAMEMEKHEMRVLFVAQHAATLDPRGVDYRSILDGTASSEDKELYHRALDDFEFKAHEDHDEGRSKWGRLEIWSPRKRVTMRRFEERIRAIRQERGLDIGVGDYLELIQSERDLGQYRLNVKDMAERAKGIARDEGIWMIMNHQISRQGREAAEKRDPKHYVVGDLGESSGVERAADTVLWVFSDEDHKDEREARIGIAKARKGKTMVEGCVVYADYPKALMAEVE